MLLEWLSGPAVNGRQRSDVEDYRPRTILMCKTKAFTCLLRAP